MTVNISLAGSEETKKHVILIKNKTLQRITIGVFFPLRMIGNMLTVSSRSSNAEVVREHSSLWQAGKSLHSRILNAYSLCYLECYRPSSAMQLIYPYPVSDFSIAGTGKFTLEMGIFCCLKIIFFICLELALFFVKSFIAQVGQRCPPCVWLLSGSLWAHTKKENPSALEMSGNRLGFCWGNWCTVTPVPPAAADHPSGPQSWWPVKKKLLRTTMLKVSAKLY